MRTTLVVAVLLALVSCHGFGGKVTSSVESPDASWLDAAESRSTAWSTFLDEDDEDEPGVEDVPDLGWTILMYLPNRLFDVLDVVRARARLGPGLSVNGRLTKPVSGAIGFHNTAWIGLHGPRGQTQIPWPAGLEAYGGANISVVDTLATGGAYYGIAEIGASAQLLLLGVDVGIEPFEVWDFVAGLVAADPVADDF